MLQAEKLLAPDDPELMTVAVEHALIAHRSGDDERAAELAGAALEAADAAAGPGDRARVNNLLGILRRNDDPELALEYLTTARNWRSNRRTPVCLPASSTTWRWHISPMVKRRRA